MDKFHNWINTSDDNYVDGTDGEYDDEFDFQPDADERPSQPIVKSHAFTQRNDRSSNVVNINSSKPSGAKPRVVFQKIDRFDDVNKVADILKEKRIVVLNLESCPNADAQRIIDVLYGVSYANDGAFKKVAGRAYIITPNNVPVSGELGDEIIDMGDEF